MPKIGVVFRGVVSMSKEVTKGVHEKTTAHHGQKSAERREMIFLMMKTRSSICFLLCCAVLLTSGCARLPVRNPLPEELANSAAIPGIPNARAWGDDALLAEHEILDMPREELVRTYSATMGTSHNYLAISGGGANGAFGAGLMVGWTAAGTRPEFTIVTGISTGALIAPFAFLGPAYDDRLKKIYTTYSTEDLITRIGWIQILTGYSAVDTTPMRKLMVKYYDQKVIDAIAEEHRNGRRLFIGTTYIDAKRPVIWNIGGIAASGIPNAMNLIHDVILASISIPGVFPPVLIDVEANGEVYDEMHVDGGTSNQAFLYPSEIDWRRVIEVLEVRGIPVAYVIRNSKLAPQWQTIEPRLVPIALRSIDSLIHTQGIGDIYRIYLNCMRDGIDFNLAFIPGDFDLEPKEPFDPVYMKQLFELGHEMALTGSAWIGNLPSLKSTQ